MLAEKHRSRPRWEVFYYLYKHFHSKSSIIAAPITQGKAQCKAADLLGEPMMCQSLAEHSGYEDERPLHPPHGWACISSGELGPERENCSIIWQELKYRCTWSVDEGYVSRVWAVSRKARLTILQFHLKWIFLSLFSCRRQKKKKKSVTK